MRQVRWVVVWLFILCLSVDTPAAEKKEKKKKGKKGEEEITQVLELPKDPPLAVSVETARLSFQAAPLSAKGLLSQQVRDGIRALWRQHRGASIIRLRAFVAGTGDLRRVQAIVSEEFTEHKLPLPVLTVVQVGALPMEGAQVALESVAIEKRPVNPQGVAFFSGQAISEKDPESATLPLVKQSLERLTQASQAVGVTAADMLQVTCFVSLLDKPADTRQAVAAVFPQAAFQLMQLQRAPSRAVAECEAAGRLSRTPGQPVELINPPGLESSPNYSQVALVNTPKLVLSGAQLGFSGKEEDVRLAFTRLAKAMEGAGGNLKRTVMARFYPLSNSVVDRVRAVRFDYLDREKPPASTLLPFEGLPSLDAVVAIEVTAAAE